MSEPLYCAFCQSALVHYGTGRSDFEHQCDACGAAFDVDAAAGVARSRRWDRKTAKGVHDEFPLAKLHEAPPASPEGESTQT